MAIYLRELFFDKWAGLCRNTARNHVAQYRIYRIYIILIAGSNFIWRVDIKCSIREISFLLNILKGINSICSEELTRRKETEVAYTTGSFSKQFDYTDVISKITVCVVLLIRLLQPGDDCRIIQIIEEILYSIVS